MNDEHIARQIRKHILQVMSKNAVENIQVVIGRIHNKEICIYALGILADGKTATTRKCLTF